MRFARLWPLVAAVASVLPLSPRTASADLGATDGFVYLLVSVDHTFQTNVDGATGSTTVLVNLGVLTGGAGILDTRFVAQAISPLSLPPGVTLGGLDGNAATIVGSFQVLGGDAHIVTPVPGAIDRDVQTALFSATHDGSLDALNNVFDDGVKVYPTTYSIALDVAQHLPGLDGQPSQAQISNVASSLFTTNQVMSGVAGVISSEGDLFPHHVEEVAVPLFHESFSLHQGTGGVVVDTDICRLVDIDVMPGNSTNRVNLKKKGELEIAFLTAGSFHASEIVRATVRIGSVHAKEFELEDVDHDGDNDLECEFSVSKLVAKGLLGLSTTTLTVEAFLADGSCVRGTDVVHPYIPARHSDHDDDDGGDDHDD